ncbi:M56 family metallopeptidase [Solibacillus sp. FSL H8-0538]|uniref:M56 family metallopeptidase n=1 Tax=Solibacillus sp. FSL H8-0538 TaxID=2921400 RepID=UPI0030F7CFF6
MSSVIWFAVFIQMIHYIVSRLVGWNVNLNLIEVCQSLLKLLGLSFLDFYLDALVLYAILFSFWKIGMQYFVSIRMKILLWRYRNKTLSVAMNKRFNTEKKDIIVVSYPETIAITMGLFNPKIVISTALINLLNEQELNAVIFHEMYHKNQNDPFKLFLLSLFASTMPYIPVLKWFEQQYRIIEELSADAWAIEKQQTPLNIGSALIKMLKIKKINAMPFTYVSFAETSINYRIEYLLNPLMDTQFKIPAKIAVISCVSFCVICILCIYAAV